MMGSMFGWFTRRLQAAVFVVVPTLLLFSKAKAETPAPASEAVVWHAIERGAEHAVVDGDFRIELFRFDLDRFRASVIMKADGQTKAQTASEVLQRSAATIAVVNGGFFDEKGRPLGLRADAGNTLVPFRRQVDWGVFYVAAGQAHIVHSREFTLPANIEAAIQVGPRILINGVVPKLKPQIARRTAVALTKDGRTLTLAVVPGPALANALGERLAALGYYTALMFDGGPSTQLAARLGGGQQPNTAGKRRRNESSEVLEIPGGYPVPDLLAIIRRLQ
jgi:exopolysaccharide biosynthesis protein